MESRISDWCLSRLTLNRYGGTNSKNRKIAAENLWFRCYRTAAHEYLNGSDLLRSKGEVSVRSTANDGRLAGNPRPSCNIFSTLQDSPPFNRPVVSIVCESWRGKINDHCLRVVVLLLCLIVRPHRRFQTFAHLRTQTFGIPQGGRPISHADRYLGLLGSVSCILMSITTW